MRFLFGFFLSSFLIIISFNLYNLAVYKYQEYIDMKDPKWSACWHKCDRRMKAAMWTELPGKCFCGNLRSYKKKVYPRRMNDKR